ncbi:LysR family transcriptional regulator [Pseudoduganella sp. UC29_106]|uniref:LysR family transcriptional regulator n=1 Tax=Pseudoduganella sp. UC29_106 TaxID=3374553 RepID=UPI003756CE19
MDWDNTRIFLGIYRAGTLRGAAALLDIDQATVGRRLNAMEAALNAKLFLRTPNGYVPTPAGEVAAKSAQQMEEAALQLEREMSGIDNRLSGTVRLATTDTIAHAFVIDAMRRLHDQHPDIRVILQVNTQLASLTRRESDLAVRTVRPTSPDLISRHLAKRAAGLYATPEYLEKRGEPQPGEAFKGHDIVIYHSSVLTRQAEKLVGEPTTNARVAMEVNTGMTLIEAVQAGIGIGELPIHIAETNAGLRRIWPEREYRYDMYLVMHADLARSARVRAVADAIVDANIAR